MSKKSAVPFRGTKEQEAKLYEVIDKYRNIDGPLMPVLQGAQEIYGYLPIEVQKIISEELDISLEHIYGVVTFYAQFSLAPKGEYQIAVCLGTACYVKGSGEILDKIKEIIGVDVGECSPDGKFSLDATSFFGACVLALVFNKHDEVFGRLTVGEIPDILAKYMN